MTREHSCVDLTKESHPRGKIELHSPDKRTHQTSFCLLWCLSRYTHNISGKLSFLILNLDLTTTNKISNERQKKRVYIKLLLKIILYSWRESNTFRWLNEKLMVPLLLSAPSSPVFSCPPVSIYTHCSGETFDWMIQSPYICWAPSD